MKGKTIGKLITIPISTSLTISTLAMMEGRSAKNYMEQLIIGHAKDNKDFTKKPKGKL